MNETLRLEITAENRQAIAALKQTADQTKQFAYSLDELKGSLKATKQELQTLTDRNQIAATRAEIGNLKNQINELEGVAQKSSNAFSGMYEKIRKIAYVLPGIGIAGLFNVAFEGIAALLNTASSSMERASKSADDLSKGMGAAAEQAEKEKINLRLLLNVAEDHSNSLKERNDALLKLKKEYPGYFDQQGIDINNTKKLEGAYNDLVGALLRKSQADTLISLIAKQQAIIAEEESKTITQKTKDLSNLALAWDVVKGAYGGVAKIGAIAAKDAIESSGDKAKDAAKQIETLTAMLLKLEAAMGGDKLGKGETYKSPLKEHVKALKEWHQLEGSIRQTIDQTGQKERDKYDPDKKRTLDQGRGMDFASLFGQDHMEKGKENLKEFEKYLQGLTDLSGRFANNMVEAINAGKSMGEVLGEVFQQLVKDIEKAIVKQTILTVLMSVTGGASGAVGTAVGGNSGGGFLQGILKSIFGKGKADGGLASGPKSGYLELLHGDEMVIPMNKMGKFVDHAMGLGAKMGGSMGGPQMVYVEGKISGNDIILAQRRADFSLNVRR